MNLNKLLDLKGINFLFLAAALALNLFWTLITTSTVAYLLSQNQVDAELVQVAMVLITFLGPLVIGWAVGRMAGDRRGPTYGVYGSLSTVMILAMAGLPTSVLGILLMLVAIAGGLNGGMLSLR